MGRVAPNPENVLSQYQQVRKFGGLKKDETRRIMLFEFGEEKPGQPFGSYFEFIHNLQIPEVKEKRPDGAEITVQERKWFGTYLCLGREDVIYEKRFDAEQCPACAHAADDQALMPVRRHATNIVVYRTKEPSFNLQEPWSVEVLPWFFSERMFREITDLYSTWGNLQRHDIQVLCESGQFQRYKLSAMPTAAWLDPAFNPQMNRGGETDEQIAARLGTVPDWAKGGLMNLVAETVRANKVPDEVLSDNIGTKVGRTTLAQKVQEFMLEAGMAAGVASGAPSQAAPPMDAQSVADMLGGNTPAPPPMVEVPGAPDLSQLATTPAPPPPAPAPVPEAPPAVPAPETAPDAPPAAPPAPAEPVTTQNITDLLS